MKALPALLILLLAFFTACSSLPTLRPITSTGGNSTPCSFPFLTENRQLVHAISATLPDGSHNVMTGISTVSPDQQTIHAVMMTLEGLVLFEASLENGHVSIQRAVPPFSSPAFAAGLMNDVRLIFLPPSGKLQEIGENQSGGQVCRYRSDNGIHIDLITDRHNGHRLVQYSSGNRIKRLLIVSSRPGSDARIPGHLTLIANGVMGYSLELELIRSSPF